MIVANSLKKKKKKKEKKMKKKKKLVEQFSFPFHFYSSAMN